MEFCKLGYILAVLGHPWRNNFHLAISYSTYSFICDLCCHSRNSKFNHFCCFPLFKCYYPCFNCSSYFINEICYSLYNLWWLIYYAFNFDYFIYKFIFFIINLLQFNMIKIIILKSIWIWNLNKFVLH